MSYDGEAVAYFSEWEFEEPGVCFVDCTCDHEVEAHGWGSCLIDGCPCEGGWEE